MPVVTKSLATVSTLYLLYVLKWAAGINFLEGYHAPEVVKLPAKVAVEYIQQLGVDITLPGVPVMTQLQNTNSDDASKPPHC